MFTYIVNISPGNSIKITKLYKLVERKQVFGRRFTLFSCASAKAERSLSSLYGMFLYVE